MSYPLGDNNRKGYGDFFAGLDVTLVGTAAEADVLRRSSAPPSSVARARVSKSVFFTNSAPLNGAPLYGVPFNGAPLNGAPLYGNAHH